jgi:cytochrome P450
VYITINFLFSEIVDVIKTMVNKYPSPFQYWLGPKLFVFTDNPDDIQILLNSPNAHSKGETYDLIKTMMGSSTDGLISSTGEKWKYHRKLLNPCFGANILESYVPIFNRNANVLKNLVDHQAKIGDVFDIEAKIRACTFDMIVGKN